MGAQLFDEVSPVMQEEIRREARKAWLEGAIAATRARAYDAGAEYAEALSAAAWPQPAALAQPDRYEPGWEGHAWETYLAAHRRADALLERYLADVNRQAVQADPATAEQVQANTVLLAAFNTANLQAEQRLKEYLTIRHYALLEEEYAQS